MAEPGTKMSSPVSTQPHRCDTNAADSQIEICRDDKPQGLKRSSSRDPSPAPPQKSPRTTSHPPRATSPPPRATSPAPRATSPSTRTSEPLEAAHEPMEHEGEGAQGKSPEGGEDPAGVPPQSPSSRRKSWRRSTRGRRSLPPCLNPSRQLCRAISPSLPEPERLEKLMEASMRLAVERTQDSLRTSASACLGSFQTQMESIQKEWRHLAREIGSAPQYPSLPCSSSSDPAMQRTMEQVLKAIQTLQVENDSWEALLKKHRGKAEELARRVEQAQEGGVRLDPASLSRSSQSQLIQSKPDYQAVLRRQQPLLHTMEMVMDSQCQMVKELMSIQEQSQRLVKEISGRLAAEAAFQQLPADPVRNLLARPTSTPSPPDTSQSGQNTHLLAKMATDTHYR